MKLYFLALLFFSTVAAASNLRLPFQERKVMIEEAKTYIKLNEGWSAKVYPDTKSIPSIGYGRNLRDRGITKEEGEYLLNNDVEEAVAFCEEKFPWFRGLTLSRQIVMIDLIYNMQGSIFQFKGFLKGMATGDYVSAAGNLIYVDPNDRAKGYTNYYKDVGSRASKNSELLIKG